MQSDHMTVWVTLPQFTNLPGAIPWDVRSCLIGPVSSGPILMYGLLEGPCCSCAKFRQQEYTAKLCDMMMSCHMYCKLSWNVAIFLKNKMLNETVLKEVIVTLFLCRCVHSTIEVEFWYLWEICSLTPRILKPLNTEICGFWPTGTPKATGTLFWSCLDPFWGPQNAIHSFYGPQNASWSSLKGISSFHQDPLSCSRGLSEVCGLCGPHRGSWTPLESISDGIWELRSGPRPWVPNLRIGRRDLYASGH